VIQQATVPTTEVDVEASVRRSSAGADVTDSDAVDLTAATRRLSPVTGDASVDAAADGVTDGLPQTSAAAAAALSEEYRRRYVKYERLCELITLKVETCLFQFASNVQYRWYAVSVCVTVRCPSVRCPSVCLPCRSIAAAACCWFAAVRQISIDRCQCQCPSPDCGQRQRCDPRYEVRHRLVS